jgi:hypothetical protein
MYALNAIYYASVTAVYHHTRLEPRDLFQWKGFAQSIMKEVRRPASVYNKPFKVIKESSVELTPA